MWHNCKIQLHSATGPKRNSENTYVNLEVTLLAEVTPAVDEHSLAEESHRLDPSRNRMPTVLSSPSQRARGEGSEACEAGERSSRASGMDGACSWTASG